MRLRTSLSLVPLLTAGLVALPTVSVPSAVAAVPVAVAPEVLDLPVDGIDATVLARSPEPEDEHAAAPAVAEADLAPVAVVQEVTTDGFSAVGVTWQTDPALDDVAVQVRTRSGGRWGAWAGVEVQLGTGSDAGARDAQDARSGSDLLFVGESDAVQVRVDSAGGTPRDVRLALIDPGTSRSDAATTDGTSDGTSWAAPALLGGSVAQAAVSTPEHVSRAGWGADESLRSCTPSSAPVLRGGILHTTATSNDYTAEQSPAVMRAMYAYHTRSLGWCDLGYNFLVDRFGTLFEGRAGSVSRHVIGSHTGGFNTGTVGVSMIGHHDLVAPTSAQLRTVERVFAWKLGGAGLDPQGTTTYVSGGGSATRYAKGAVVRKPVISGHRDYSPKSCPGNLAYPLLGEIRASVAAVVAADPSAPPLLRAVPPPLVPARDVTIGIRQAAGIYTFTGRISPAEAGVQVTTARLDGVTNRVTGVASTRTDAAGRYTIRTRLPKGFAGFYSLSATRSGIPAGRSRLYGLVVPR